MKTSERPRMATGKMGAGKQAPAQKTRCTSGDAGQESAGATIATGKPVDDIDRLATMRIGELQALVAELTGEKTRCPNRAWLIKKVMEAAVPVAQEGEVAAAATGKAEPELTASGAAPSAATGPQVGPQVNEAGTDAAAGPKATTGHLVAKVIATAATSEPESMSSAPPTAATDQKLSKLDLPALRSLYAEVVGRESQSSNSAYLIWKIRQARRRRIPTGPRKNARAEGASFKVLPLRMEADLVDRLDEVWPRLGLRSRMDLFRIALRTYFAGAGEQDLADLLSATH